MISIMVSPLLEAASSPVTMTADDILRLKADYEADVRLYEDLPARIKLKKRRFEAAMLFAPDGFDPNAPADQTQAPVPPPVATTPPSPQPAPAVPVEANEFELAREPAERLTWVGELARVLNESSRGLSHKEALAMLKATPLGDSASTGDKGFYNAVFRLEGRGQLIKSGGLLYSKKLVDEMKARGEYLPDVTTETRRRAGGAATMILSVLKSNPEGLDGNELRKQVAAMPGVPSSMSKHSHYIYNILATLIGQGAVVKDDGGRYRAKDASVA